MWSADVAFPANWRIARSVVDWVVTIGEEGDEGDIKAAHGRTRG